MRGECSGFAAIERGRKDPHIPGPAVKGLVLLALLPAQALLRLPVSLALLVTLAGCLSGLSPDQLREMVKDKDAAAACAEAKAPHPFSIGCVTADTGVAGEAVVECGGTKLIIKGPGGK